MASRRQRRQRREKGVAKEQTTTQNSGSYYYRNYKKLLYIPFILLILSLLQISYQVATTGDFINKGVSLQGGLTLTIPATGITVDEVESLLLTTYPETDFIVRGISEFGEVQGVVIEVATTADPRVIEEGMINEISTLIPEAKETYGVEIVGPSLGNAFFVQTLKAIIIAFLLMGLVVFLYFGLERSTKYIAALLTIVASILLFNTNSTIGYVFVALLSAALIYIYIKYSLPSAAVMLAAISDIIMTVAVVNIIGIKVSAAGIAAFLMLIGYSVDTDILLSTRVLKRTSGTVYERVLSSFKTGMTMMVTSMIAALVALLVTQSETISQIMLIIFIGLVADIINTWLQNAGLIRMYAEKRGLQ